MVVTSVVALAFTATTAYQCSDRSQIGFCIIHGGSQVHRGDLTLEIYDVDRIRASVRYFS